MNDEQGGSAHGVRVFAGPRWDPFIMDAPRGAEDDRDRASWRSPIPARSTSTARTSSASSSRSTRALLGGAELVGVVAETLTRGRFNVRIERVGRPEVKNMMLAPKQFDPVNRDLEIRDLYNMEDAFHLGDGYQGAYRARLNANLAFWDGLDGKADWAADGDGDHPLTELVLADYLVVDLTKPYAEQGSFLEIELAALRGRGARDLRRAGAQRRRDGHDLHPAHQRRERARHPRRRRPGRRGRPRARFPYLAPPNPDPPEPPEHLLSDDAVTATDGRRRLELDDIQSGALHERPSPYVGTYLLLRIDDRAAGRELVRRLHPARRLRTPVVRSGARRLDHGRLHLPGPEGARRAAGVAGQLRAGVPAGDGGARGRAGRRRREQPRALGEAARHRRRPRRPGGALARRRAAARPSSSRRAAPTRSCPASR